MPVNHPILIVEDEPLIAADISSVLLANGYSISAKVRSADKALDHLAHNKVSLALLDIKIEGTKNGIALASEIQARYQVPHIFITSYYDTNTLETAGKTNPLAYLVKPFDERDLLVNVGLGLYKTMNPALRASDKFFVRNQQDMVAVDVHDIIYVQADDNYATLFTAKGKHVVSHTLKSVEEKLLSFGFIRVHRSYLVNFQKITAISEGNVLLDMHKIPLGNSYREDLIRQLSFL